MQQPFPTDEIYNLVRQGQKIQAIKAYRQLTGVGLKEAKDAIDLMETGLPVSNPSPQKVPTANDPLDPDHLQLLLRQGRKIEAIKAYRQLTGVGLKEAKEAIDLMETGLPASYLSPQKVPTANNPLDPDQLQLLLRQGRKIEAIKYYRQATGVGLKEAKDAVDLMETDFSASNLPSRAVSTVKSLLDPDHLQLLLRQGRKIEAIKYYRQTTTVSFKEAVEAVEWLQNNMPAES